MNIQPEDVVARRSVYSSRIKDDLVLFDEAAGQYFATGSVGADIWGMMETPCSIRAICAALMERYEVDEETCLAEVQRFVEGLVEAGLAEQR